MAYAAGVDVGSTQTKAIIINEDKEIVARALIDTGANVTAAAQKAFEVALKEADISEQEVEREQVQLQHVSGLFWRQPLLAGLMLVALLSLAGIPLTAGFIAKFYIVSAAVSGGNWVLLGALVIGSGFGGLAAAIRLSAKGWRVQVLEKMNTPGGRARARPPRARRRGLSPRRRDRTGHRR